MKEVWFHGTSEENAFSILQEGFKEGTYFAKHMEQAIKFGGPCILWVNVDWDRPSLDGWQQVSSNRLDPKTICGLFQTSGWFED